MTFECAVCLRPAEACHLCPLTWAPVCPVCEQPGHDAADCPWLLEAGEVPGAGRVPFDFMSYPTTSLAGCPLPADYRRITGVSPHGEENDTRETLAQEL